ncbi:MAG: hypothetical protein ABI432_10065 [Flavobacteriales bacterium]
MAQGPRTTPQRIDDRLMIYAVALQEALSALAFTADVAEVRRLSAWIDTSAYAVAMDVRHAHKRHDPNLDYALDLAMADHFKGNDALADYAAYRTVDRYYKTQARITPAPYRELLYLSELAHAVAYTQREARYVRMRNELMEYASALQLVEER